MQIICRINSKYESVDWADLRVECMDNNSMLSELQHVSPGLLYGIDKDAQVVFGDIHKMSDVRVLPLDEYISKVVNPFLACSNYLYVKGVGLKSLR